MPNRKINIKGVSLTLVIGLVALLMVTSAAVNQLIIQSYRSVHRIEASNRAFLIAEAGIEDALYELSAHFAGYETPNLGTADARSTQLDGNNWYNEWEIESKSRVNKWGGKMVKNEKLIIPLFNDTNGVPGNSITGLPKGIAKNNAVNDGTAQTTNDPFDSFDIKALDPSNIKISFKIPSFIFTSFGTLLIDNDEDFGFLPSGIGLNEDGAGTTGPCPTNPEDDDCDGLVDEDSAEDPVIMWKLTDGKDRSLIPVS